LYGTSESALFLYDAPQTQIFVMSQELYACSLTTDWCWKCIFQWKTAP